MQIERRIQLECMDAQLTEEERKAGFHFCPEFDYGLVGFEDLEFEFCTCDQSEDI